MKTKMLVIVGVVLLLFVGLFAANQYKNKQATEGVDNPYDKDNLHQETIKLLKEPLYNNIIIPNDLEDEIDSGEAITVYFFSPTCSYCQQTTPVVVPLTEKLDIEMKKMNLLEYDEMDKYGIEGTPTIVHYEGGEEVARIVGYHEEDDFKVFFDEYVLN